MATIQEKIAQAKAAGYSDADIATHLSGAPDFGAKIKAATDAGYKPEEIIAHLSTVPEAPKKEPPSVGEFIKSEAKQSLQNVGNLAAGAVRGAGSIGATILAPYDMAKDAMAGKGLSLESNRQRRADMDAGLREMGADTDSFMYGAGKLSGEIAGTAGAGGVLAQGARAVAPAATGFANALASGGFTTGNRLARTASLGAKSADMGTRIAGGAVTGGVAAGVVDPEYAATGATVGGMLPVLAKAGGAVGRTIGSITKKGGQRRAVEEIAGTIGENKLSQAVGDIQTYYPRGAENIPVSSAAVTKLPELARLEQGSRLRTSPSWYDFDLKQSKAVADNVMKATDEASELSARFAKRTQNWADNWAKASDNIKPRIFAKRMGSLYDDLQQAKASPDAVNSEVSSALQEIEDTVMKFGKGFTPEHLQKLRAEFNGKVKPMAKTAMKSAPRDNPAIKSLIAELDDILNASTSGKWDKVRQGYAQDSGGVHAAKAAQIVRNAFIEPSTGIVRKAADAAGDIPKITDAGLMRAIDAARLPDKSLALSDESAQRLEATLDALRHQGIVQGVKRSAAAGGGSDSIGNALAVGAEAAAPGGVGNALLKAFMQGGRRVAMGRKDNAMANLLMSPDELAIALQAYAGRANRSPSVLEQAPYRVLPLLASERQ